MADYTRHIGLSLGADICWPICYEALLRELDLTVRDGDDVLRFAVDRVSIEPFSLSQPVRYDVVIDRLTHWYHTSREWIKKAIVHDDLYVFNNPFSLTSMEKHTSYAAMMRLGFPVPETWMIPPKAYPETADLEPTLTRYARLFDLEELGERVGYPMFMKPYDGGAWVGVTRVTDGESLKKAYDESGIRVMHLQKAVSPHDVFVRCLGLGPQTRHVNYDPDAPLHDRYRMETDFIDDADKQRLTDMTLVINAFFGWDFNSCEALRVNGVWHPIDFANACPDSQVTSLHYHFPWLIKANLRWSIFCAATKRRMHTDFGWREYFDIAADGGSFDEKLAAYVAIAKRRFNVDEFESFCATHLADLDERANAFFGSDTVRDAIRQKVTALFPEHEIDEFTELFWDRIQTWRAQEGAGA